MEYSGDSMNLHTIRVVTDFSASPYGRYTREVGPNQQDSTGERFREEHLIPALKLYDKVHVILTGYNRYAPSFIDEAFGGLISSGAFSFEEVNEKLTYEHSDLPSIEALIKSRIENAARHFKNQS